MASAPLKNAPRAEPDAKGHYVVDLLVLHTPLAEARLNGSAAVSALAENLTASANTYFANSLVPVRYRLVGVGKSSATSDDAGYFTNQAEIAADPGVRAHRDRVGADLVVLLRANEGTNFCGLGGLFNGGEQTDPPANVGPDRDAFAVIGAAPDDNGNACADLPHLFAHELGHCMGGGHQYIPSGVYVNDGGTVQLGAYWKPYAHATYCGLSDGGLRNNTIMTGGVRVDGVYLQGGEMRGDYFSNPALSVDGLPCGVAPAESTEPETNNAKSISEAAPYVAAYRAATQAPRRTPEGGGSMNWAIVMLLGCTARAARRLKGTSD